MTTEKKTYTPEFKMDAVRLVTEQGYKVTEAARNLGIHPSVLNRWKRQLATDGTERLSRQRASDPGKGGTAATPQRNQAA